MLSFGKSTTNSAPGAKWAMLLLALSAGQEGCSTPPLRFEEVFPGFTLAVDESPAWSHDGRTIAFHRRIPSADGPAGVFLVSPLGGKPRFLAPGSLFFPNDLTFSPDDRYLAGVDGFQLWIVDVRTGEVTRPMYTQEGVRTPDWSPDGKKILYTRNALGNLDSIGIHIFDLETGVDDALKVNGQIVYGDDPLWTRDGRWIACIDPVGPGEKVVLVKADGSERRVIASTEGDWRWLRRYYRPAHGQDGFFFNQQAGGQPDAGAYYVNADGSGQVRMAIRFIFMQAFSPDGSEYVIGGADPSDTNFVLFVAKTDDPTETSRRPITSYEPPPGQPSPPAALWSVRRPSRWGRATR